MPTHIDPRGKLFQHLDRLAQLQQGDKGAPVNVEIDASNRCNLGCEWCHFSHTHTRGPLAYKRAVEAGDLLDTDLALRVIRELCAMGVHSLTWSGGGEPTLHPDIALLVEAPTIPQGMYTNGTRLNEPLAALLKRRLAWVYVSLDAADGDDYMAQKGVTHKQFEAACTGVKRLVAADGNATVGVGFLLHAGNWQRARDMLLLGRGLGADYVQFRPVIDHDLACPSERAGDADWVLDAMPTLRALEQESGVEIDVSRFAMYRDWQGHGYRQCWWSALQTVITPDGRVWACLNKRGFEDAALGDLRIETFADIWQRAPVQDVNERCRVMCRGHIPNRTLAPMMGRNGHVHTEFI